MTRLTTYTPSADLGRMQREMDRLFDSFFRPAREGSAQSLWQPSADFYETADEFVVELDLPGMRKQDVNVEFEDGTLRISGERRLLHEEEHTYHRTERRHGRFARTVHVGPDVQPDNIEASFENGVLTVHVPKVEHKKPVTIEVK